MLVEINDQWGLSNHNRLRKMLAMSQDEGDVMVKWGAHGQVAQLWAWI